MPKKLQSKNFDHSSGSHNLFPESTLGGDFGFGVHEVAKCSAKVVGKLLGGTGNEVGKKVGFEAQPQSFNGVEVWTVGGQVNGLKMMPAQPLGFMPRSVVEDEQAAEVRLRRDGLGKLIEPALEDIGVHAIEDHGKTLPSDRSHRSDDVGPDVFAHVRHLGPTAPRTPAAAGTWITLC
jgi:hypothetical protein